ncbi:hypothetical protein DES53_103356 [Roseimicrobium gellanilyticum]|uniref:Uncharacterized protein n=2 Tax=Roseimicrobium gellanilyticum TaxID=748857 RepID=A0A366HRI2_9BACT|nr:hypothetical protein DES53_103356 [Roseimicrobium gellanilyticum]
MVAILLQPAALMAHDTDLVYARIERKAPGGKVTLQATVECRSNPLVPDQETAREALATMFDLQKVPDAQEQPASRGVVGRPLGEPDWSVQKEWTDATVPVPVQSPADGGEEHCWVTARWELELPKYEAVCLHVSPETKLGALLWEVHRSGQSPDGKTRWQILLPGDRSSRLNVPEIRKAGNVAQATSNPSRGWGWPVAGIGTLTGAILTVGVFCGRRPLRKRWARTMEAS